MSQNDWKTRLGVVYSTNPDYQFSEDNRDEEMEKTPIPGKQKLFVALDKRNRGGKQVTIIKGFIGLQDDLEELGKLLKNRCGIGGSVKSGEIILQGDHRERVTDILTSMGYNAKRAN